MGIPVVKIERITAREILDSRGFPTVEVDLLVKTPNGSTWSGRAAVPSGASTGEGEALELRDEDPKRFGGKGVRKAIQNIRDAIAPAIVGREFPRQSLLDEMLLRLDGTDTKSKLGANAILAVSLAFCRAHSRAAGVPTYALLAELFEGTMGSTLPVPLMNILNGGKHGENGLDIQEFMIVPAGLSSFSEALRAGSEIFQRLKKILKAKGLSVGVGDEGGFAPQFSGDEPHAQALGAIAQAVQDAGYKLGKDIFLALDCASSEFSKSGTEGTVYTFEGKPRTADQMIEIYAEWMKSYPIVSIEDGLAEHDWTGWAKLTEKLGKSCQLVGDDLFCTNPRTLRRGIDAQVANAILIKVNQIGTLTETLETMRLARSSKYRSITSHRSGETEDVFIAELAVGTDCGQIKTGSASRTDRIAKYNQLLRIEEELGSRARYAGLAGLGL